MRKIKRYGEREGGRESCWSLEIKSEDLPEKVFLLNLTSTHFVVDMNNIESILWDRAQHSADA